ncbi:ATP-dependent DNA helicase [Caerostris extrusa]|uniref:ATP-dependent DNA helicase n=1 Tax=Caerostris extrusa TaxID=172846 RepID=A0AAV4VV08_CAEEX|nr:ATP-dependent DNA helicase [Caerostris extrusa]
MDTTMDKCKRCLTNLNNVNMNRDILLLSETWTILRDTFELNGFNHPHLVSDLSRRRPSGMSICIKHHLKPLVEGVKMYPNQDLGIHVLVANFKTKVRVAVLYAKPGSSDDDITDAIDESLDCKNRDYKNSIDFNIDMGTERGREFCKIMDQIYY